MKILFLLTQDMESPAGIGRFGPLARELVRLGHTVNIAALHSNYQSLSRKRFTHDGVNIWYVAPMHVRKAGNVKSYYSPLGLMWVLLRATLALSWAALVLPADIIHVGKPHPMNGLAGLVGKYLRGRRLFLDCDDLEAEVNHFSAAWQRRWMAAFERWLPRRVDVITVHTDFIRSRLLTQGIPSERIYYLSNGVDRRRFEIPDLQVVASLRRKFGIEQKKIVAYIGSLSLAGHPVDLLLNAFVAVHHAQPDSILLIVGGGEDLEALNSLASRLGIAPVVVFSGRIPPADINLYYRLASVSVDPVYDDQVARARQPLKLFESWACGVPFVSADVGDRRLLLGDPPAGLLSLPGDPDSLAQSILQILNGSALASDLRQRGFERVKDYYWDQLVQRLDERYKS
jgi:glycosyltransferase involved in cell wall biosynthesis